MTSLIPTSEQLACIDAAAQPDSLMISALAGTAKTTTLAMMSTQVRSPALALAFNRRIAEELRPRLPAHFTVKTLNGLGHGVWIRALDRSVTNIKLDDRKQGKLITELARQARIQLSTDLWDQARQLVSKAMQTGLVPAGSGPEGLTPDSDEIWTKLCDDLSIDPSDAPMLIELARAVLRESITQAKLGVISFDDQIYCPTLLLSASVWPRFPTVFVDEAQDLSQLNHEMLRKSTQPSSGRICAVGDPKQCFPPGTQISITGEPVRTGRFREAEIEGEIVRQEITSQPSLPIEDLHEGLQLVSFNSQKTYFPGTRTQGRKVLGVHKFEFDGELIQIHTGEFQHKCTPNHRCLVRFNSGDFYCIYIMRKDNQYRVGKARAKYENGFGPTMRARQEGADAIWILTSTQSETQALIEEKVICAKYGLPDLVFMNTSEASTSQHLLDSAWTRIGRNEIRAEAALKAYGREISMPIWSVDQRRFHIGFYSFITEACNLITGYMSVKVFDGDERDSRWLPIDVSRTPYRGPVFGIEIEPAENGRKLYVANGIVTHNSIYHFRGADADSMKNLRRLRPNWTDLPLLTTFRCPKKVVARQQVHAPGYRAHEANPDGVVDDVRADATGELARGWSLDSLGVDSAELAVLCRNNAPILSLAFKFLRSGVGVRVLGRDIGKSLVALSRKIEPDDSAPRERVAQKVSEWEERESSVARANDQLAKLDSISDRAECLRATLTSAEAQDAGQLRSLLERLFARERGQVTLSSIHRAKGLEWNTVLHLDPWRVPSRQSKRAAAAGDASALTQEHNLIYVAETRTRNRLILANLEDFEQ